MTNANMQPTEYMVIVPDASHLPRAWGIAPTPDEAREIAMQQADKYEAAHPDNKLDRDHSVTHKLRKAQQ